MFILSWNLCFNCMDPTNTYPKNNLANNCFTIKNDKENCFSNANDLLGRIQNKNEYPYLYAFQEASKSTDFTFLGQKSNDYSYINTKMSIQDNLLLQNVEMTTYYNNKKLQLLFYSIDNLNKKLFEFIKILKNDGNPNDHDNLKSYDLDIRPFHFCIFKILETNQIIIFINLHNDHIQTTHIIEHCLSETLDNKLIKNMHGNQNIELNITYTITFDKGNRNNKLFNISEYLDNFQVNYVDISSFIFTINNINTGIVIAGDFNSFRLWQGIYPFLYS